MADQLTTVFAALADPTRRAILHRLTQGDANVADLAEPFAMSQPAISKHLKVLESAGLISRNRVATARFSHLEAEPLKEATEYMEKYRRFWKVSFDRLDEALAAYQNTANSAAEDAPQHDAHTNKENENE
ncbi:ArsR/SmtB family transcription factor [Glaciibacter superstes]|uniref:ArsR/SmtB family transcription factor n=1 Tax=Glaciibacter superstes TaxID=501023 RepID=UPI0003B78AC5|nr:metalloregulator ArsR/SmtB family transcription factor [Glaciibacter superstes]